MRSRLGRAAAFVATGLIVIAWFVALRPASLGGLATYVIVRGDSMLPTLDTGDLVLLRANASYDVGDLVGYRVPQGELGAGLLVVHRIVGGDGIHGYVLQGDNNPAVDPWMPRDGDVAGRRWLVVPGVGRAIAWIHQPATLGAAAAALIVILVVSGPPHLGTPRRSRSSGAPSGLERPVPSA